ncbi:MAG TPA: ion channel [Verrucomicrobiae bacterium]|nr:ion channel [Verrucomicrobiae bacterium]
MLATVGIVAGVVLIVASLNDLFQSVIVPRAVGRRYRVSFLVWRALWKAWPQLAWLLYRNDSDRREDFLAIFAPFALVALLATWTLCLLSGYALIFWTWRAHFAPQLHSFGEALYYSGTSLATLGYGDVVARSGAARFFSILEALTGLAMLSITTAFFFALFGSFQSRESFVVIVGGRAGSPPSGVNLVAIAGYTKTSGHGDQLWIDAQRWAATLMESHLAYPHLAFFRSSHDNESWIGTLGCLLDAAVLVMTTLDGPPSGEARLFFNIGRHATGDLARYFSLAPRETRVERAEFERACDRLERAGYALQPREEAWERFSNLRSSYAGELNALAHFFSIPPLQWIGDRSTIHHHSH